MSDRGEFRNKDNAAQLRLFSGIKHGTITPIDIDLFIEYHDELFIYVETKYKDAEVPTGQRLALARQCDADERGGRGAICFITRHEFNRDEDIDMAHTVVTEYRHKGAWHRLNKHYFLIDAIDGYISKNSKGR